MGLLLENGRAVLSLASSPLSVGGEGSIFEVPGSRLVAKVYHQPSREREKKLRAMLANPPPLGGGLQRGYSLTWPLDLVLTASKEGACVGYLMERVSNKEPLSLHYNPKTRRKEVDRAFLLRTARRLASAVNGLHRKDYIVGDVNDSNVLLGLNGELCLV